MEGVKEKNFCLIFFSKTHPSHIPQLHYRYHHLRPTKQIIQYVKLWDFSTTSHMFTAIKSKYFRPTMIRAEHCFWTAFLLPLFFFCYFQCHFQSMKWNWYFFLFSKACLYGNKFHSDGRTGFNLSRFIWCAWPYNTSSHTCLAH